MERNFSFRQIFLDGRPLPEDPNPAWNGYSTGHRDRDALVVESNGLRDGLWADYLGSPLTGIDAKVISKRIGHSRASFTMDVYAHVMPGQDNEAAKATDAGLRKALAPTARMAG